MNKILIVDDEKNILNGLLMAFQEEGFKVYSASNGKEAWSILTHNEINLVITDLKMPEMGGEELIKKISSSYPRLPVIVLTGHGNIENAVQAMQSGAVDFFTKPVDLDKLFLVVKKILQNVELEDQNKILTEEIEKLKRKKNSERIFGRSEKIHTLLETIEQVSQTKAPVLIQGEAGSGKELVADTIYNLSDRKDKPYLKFHTQSVPQNLLIDELFGSDLDSRNNRNKSIFEKAEGGTLYIDEVSLLPLNAQEKLLSILKEKVLYKNENETKVDVRLITSSKKNLQQEVKKGLFIEDLFYRISVVEINVPPLRERKDDITVLTNNFINSFSHEYNKAVDSVSQNAMKLLYSYSWPSNIRELKNAIESSVLRAKTRVIEIDDLPLYLKEDSKKQELVLSLPITLREVEEKLINETIEYCKGNKTKASALLAIGRKTLHRKLNEFREEKSE